MSLQDFLPELSELPATVVGPRLAWAFRLSIAKRLDHAFWRGLGVPEEADPRAFLDRLERCCPDTSRLISGLKEAVEGYAETVPALPAGAEGRRALLSSVLSRLVEDGAIPELNAALGRQSTQRYWVGHLKAWAAVVVLGAPACAGDAEVDLLLELLWTLQHWRQHDDDPMPAAVRKVRDEPSWTTLRRWENGNSLELAKRWSMTPPDPNTALWRQVAEPLWTVLAGRIGWPRRTVTAPRDLHPETSLLFNNAKAVWDDLVLVDRPARPEGPCRQRPAPLEGIVRLRTLAELGEEGGYASTVTKRECERERAAFDAACPPPDRADCAPGQVRAMLGGLALETERAWCCVERCGGAFEATSLLGLYRDARAERDRVLGYLAARRPGKT